jgi:hypothetical protein
MNLTVRGLDSNIGHVPRAAAATEGAQAPGVVWSR